MANRERGEVGIDVNGKRYTFRPTLNAICALEELTGKGMDEISRGAEAGRVAPMRALVWAYLQAYHADEIKTLEDAGRWMDDVGLDTITAQLADTNRLNANGETTTTGGSKRPRRAQAGGTSTLKVAESA